MAIDGARTGHQHQHQQARAGKHDHHHTLGGVQQTGFPLVQQRQLGLPHLGHDRTNLVRGAIAPVALCDFERRSRTLGIAQVYGLFQLVQLGGDEYTQSPDSSLLLRIVGRQRE